LGNLTKEVRSVSRESSKIMRICLKRKNDRKREIENLLKYISDHASILH
jgi:hypothetical protein